MTMRKPAKMKLHYCEKCRAVTEHYLTAEYPVCAPCKRATRKQRYADWKALQFAVGPL